MSDGRGAGEQRSARHRDELSELRDAASVVRVGDGAADQRESERGQELHGAEQTQLEGRAREIEDVPRDRRAQPGHRGGRAEATREEAAKARLAQRCQALLLGERQRCFIVGVHRPRRTVSASQSFGRLARPGRADQAQMPSRLQSRSKGAVASPSSTHRSRTLRSDSAARRFCTGFRR